ncbi:hypothetical protein GTP23_22370 [Pseudoduganella sp. FT93W]|uniref:TrfA protein n=1 Tax=Duganella fentianensis TaxID=2692177 RepID=A0A845I2I2_9BURK|nr:plasmid replication initiator TrfA [Duganella fentianensis]MYN47784.1 hypothetical protein [Duganella fentianensis]
MNNTTAPATVLRRHATKYRKLAEDTAKAALHAPLSEQDTILRAAERLAKNADSLERRALANAAQPTPSVVTLSVDATGAEVKKARKRQAIQQGTETYLPAWSDVAMGLPTHFLRSALFSTREHVQTCVPTTGDEEHSSMVVNKKINSFDNLNLTLTGYELSQFDRKVYATCLDYYRDSPLAPKGSESYIKTTFYQFIKRMGQSYGLNTHRAIRASLLRLSLAQLRLRYNDWNLEVPKLLTVSFKDGAINGKYNASDILTLQISESIAKLFGPGQWTAVDKDAVIYDGLKGWLASFYAGHSQAAWLPVDTLRQISGYSSDRSNFKKSLIAALEKLKEECTPNCSRVSEYHFKDDGTAVMVVRSAWKK